MKRKLIAHCRGSLLVNHVPNSLADTPIHHQYRLPLVNSIIRRHHQQQSTKASNHRASLLGHRNEVTRTSSQSRLLTTRCQQNKEFSTCQTRAGKHQVSPTYATMNTRTYSSSSPRQSNNQQVSNPNDEISSQKPMKYAIALGSNMGDRFHWIELACRSMEQAGLRILNTSSLWQTKAMYVVDQADFLNGVCMIETVLPPLELMRTLQRIENNMGRVKVVDKGPRNIDLDILLWEGGAFASKDPDLTIPHRLMEERDFVLAPLCELHSLPVAASDTPSPTDPPKSTQLPFHYSSNGRQYLTILHELWRPYLQAGNATPISSCTQLSKTLPPLFTSQPTKKTHVMSILNLTPDSFSDGGHHAWNDETYLRSTILSHLDQGATIIDLGGQSSRPGAPDITAEEEISRIRPALDILASLRKDINTPPFAVSVDTYRTAVARAAVEAGADIVNDVSAGTLDPDMLRTVAELGCTYALMHMRGTPHTMTSKEHTTYDGDLIRVIEDELVDRVAAAEAAGIRRWRMLLDPGIGFAKTGEQNLEILRRAGELTSSEAGRNVDGVYRFLGGLPWLFGSSRKGFVGKATGVKEARLRTGGTAATVAAAVQAGVDVVRVHDVAEMTQVVRMSEAIWRVD